MESNLFDVKGKVVVMTGACGVLGSTIVKYFAAQGASVVLLDLERAAAIGEKLVVEIKADGGEASFFATNVLDKSVLEKNNEQILSKYGKIDVLLNAAGGNMASATVPPDKTIFDLDVEAVKKVTELNLFGTIIPTMVFAKSMVETGKGSIINFASESALRPLTRGRLWCRQGSCRKLDQIPLRRTCDEIRRRSEGQCNSSRLPSYKPEPCPACE